jgi:hypothetical protein
MIKHFSTVRIDRAKGILCPHHFASCFVIFVRSISATGMYQLEGDVPLHGELIEDMYENENCDT